MKAVYVGRVRAPIIVGVIIGAQSPCFADWQISGLSSIESRYYLQDAAWPGQAQTELSVMLQPEFFNSWNDGDDSLVIKPFARVARYDNERTHVDIRELQWLHVSGDIETRVGIGKVFWGQTESLHLVDIINQTDAVEAVDGEEKLGQPMVNVRWATEWGTWSAYVLPYFRERTFSGEEGRLRPPVAIDVDNPMFESEDEERHVDYALRWQHNFDSIDLGLSYFAGTTREPELLTDTSTGQLRILPFYAQIQQVGIDALWVEGQWLWKFEAIYREGQSQDFFASVVGFERTWVGIADSNKDLGLLVEYQYDEREDNFFAVGQNDLMLGARLVFNDVDGTEFLAGMVQDLDVTSTYGAFIEASSRMGENWRWRLDGYFFSSDDQNDPFFFLRRDDHIQFTLEYYF